MTVNRDHTFEATFGEVSSSSHSFVEGPAVVGAPVKWTLMIENYSIEYQTAAPLKTEDKPLLEEGKLIKNVSVESNASVHYYNVSSDSDLDTPATSVSLYLLVNDSRLDVTDDPAYAVVPIDLDGDGLYERLQWVVPQLSKKDFLTKRRVDYDYDYKHEHEHEESLWPLIWTGGRLAHLDT